jgi:hypothetical protein
MDQKHPLLPKEEGATLSLPLSHPNIRGKECYQ